MKNSRLLFLASWVILLVLSAAIVLLSISSLVVAYTGTQDNITPTFTLNQLRDVGGHEVVNAIRGRRATAATWALAYGILCAWVVVLPYRRGERWAWWALLMSLGLAQLLSLVRVVAFGATFGAGTPGIVLAFLLLGLMAGVPRMFSGRDKLPEI